MNFSIKELCVFRSLVESDQDRMNDVKYWHPSQKLYTKLADKQNQILTRLDEMIDAYEDAMAAQSELSKDQITYVYELMQSEVMRFDSVRKQITDQRLCEKINERNTNILDKLKAVC